MQTEEDNVKLKMTIIKKTIKTQTRNKKQFFKTIMIKPYIFTKKQKQFAKGDFTKKIKASSLVKKEKKTKKLGILSFIAFS